MPLLEFSADIKPVVSLLGDISNQVPFATAIAINRTLEEGQAAIRRGITQRFRLRTSKSAQFLLNTIQIAPGDRATKTNLKARLAIPDERNVLARFEQGGPKVARNLSFPFAIPTDALRPSFDRTVPQEFLPKNLGLVPRRDVNGSFVLHARGRSRKAGAHVTASGVVQLKGKLRTFVIGQPGSRQWGVFQRLGPGRGDIRMIWSFRQGITDPPLLHFEETLRQVTAERFNINWDGAMAYAIATAR